MAAGCRISALLDRLVTEKLKAKPKDLRRGLEVDRGAVDFPFGHTIGLRELTATPSDLTDEEQATIDACATSTADSKTNTRTPTNCPTRWTRLGEDRDGARRLRRSAGQLRSRRDRPRRRLRQHRRGRRPLHRSWLSSAPKTRRRPAARRLDRSRGERDAGEPSTAAVQRAVITIGGQLRRRRTRTTPSSRCPTGW